MGTYPQDAVYSWY